MIKWLFDTALKDIRRKKARFILGVLAIGLSISMIIVINGAVTNFGNNYANTQFTDLSDADIVVQQVSHPVMSNVSNLMETFSDSNLNGVSARYQTAAAIFYKQLNGKIGSLAITVIGINFTQENLIKLGEFNPDISGLDINESIVIGSFGEQLLQTFGNNLNITMFLPTSNILNVSLKVVEKVDQYRRIPTALWNVVVVDLKTMQLLTGQDTATSIVGVFSDHQSLYSISNIGPAITEAKNRAIKIQKELGLDYSVSLPLVKRIQLAESALSSQYVFMNFIGFIVLLISSILIFSFINTLVEEKISEFGIYRAIGAKHRFIFEHVVVHALIDGLIGAIIGIIGGIFFLWFFGINAYQPNINNIDSFSIYFYAIIISMTICLLATFYPAIHATKKQILVALDISKAESSEFQSRITNFRFGWIKGSYILWGIVFSGIGFFIFVFFPSVEHLGGQNALNTIAFVLIIFLLLGLILIVLGLAGPILEKLLLFIFSTITYKTAFVSKLFVRKNRRRNNFTMLIYALTFAFIFFLVTIQAINYQDNIYALQSSVGSDIMIYSSGSANNQWLDNKILNFSQSYSGIKASFLTMEGIFPITGSNILIGDDILFNTYSPNLFGTNSDLLQALFSSSDLIMNSNFESLNQNGTIAISASLAKALDVGLNDHIRIKVFSSIYTYQQKYGKDSYLTIVAILNHLPGLQSVTSDQSQANGSAVFIGQKTWQWLVSSSLDNGSTSSIKMENYIQRIFIKNVNANLENFKTQLFLNFGTEIHLIDYQEQLTTLEQTLTSSLNGLTIILSFSIIIALFAVLSATTSTVLEARTDIGVLKALGLKNHGIRVVFIIEAIIICIASTLVGGLAGYLTAYFPTVNNALYNNRPIPIIIPPPAIIATYLCAIVLACIGSYLPARKTSHMEISSILR